MNRLGAALALGCAALVVGCSDPVAVNPPPALLHQASLNRGSTHVATLDVAGGANSVRITAADLPGKLVSVTTSPASGQRPVLTAVPGGIVNVQFASVGPGAASSVVDVVLDRSVVWRIDLAGGATSETVDMTGARLASLDLSAGASVENLTLPATSGTQVVREEGGASKLTVTMPSAAAARVDVHGGAGSLTIGRTTHTGIGGDQSFVDPTYSTAKDRLDLELQGGVSRVKLSRG
ncbi:MAG TPA: hypothetical protein VHV79_13455 [Mycobacteriales bacterium]|jgi:hypothetical protein|nr:hypothetical protein [Mycobacteriales bacterium]